MSTSDAGNLGPQGHLPRPRGFGPQKTPPAARPDVQKVAAEWERTGPMVPGPAVLTPATTAPPDASTLLRAVQRRWLLALTLGLLCAGGTGAAAWYLLPARSTVFSLVAVSSSPQFWVPRDRYEGNGDFGTYLKSQANRIKHRAVLTDALKQDEVKRLPIVREQPEPVQWLEDELKIEITEGSEIVRISMTGSEPDQLLTLIDAVTKAYLKETGEVERLQRAQRKDKVEKLHTDNEHKLRELQDQLIQQAKDGTHLSPIAMEKQRNVLGTWGEKQKELNQVQVALARAKRDLENWEAQAGNVEKLSLPEDIFNKAVETDPTARKYLDQKAQIEEVIQDYVDRGAGSNSTVTRLRGRLESAQKLLDKRREEIRTDLMGRYRKDAQRDFEVKTLELKKFIPELEEEKAALTEVVKQLTAQVDQLGKSSAEMEMLRIEIDQQKGLVDKLGKEFKTLEAELTVPPRVSLYQAAALQKKDIKRQLLATVLAPVSALVGVGLLIGWWENRRRRVYSADEVVTGLGLRLVGAVPPLAQDNRRRLTIGSDGFDPSEHNVVESIDGIRTVLLRDASVSAMRVVMVTSATSGEGKTTLAGHLAISLARAGRRTLLLDCDLRRPAAHQLFEQALQPGLSEILLKEIDLNEALRPTTALEGLWLLPAGQWDRDVLQALAQEEGTQRIFERLRSQFDFIVVDSSPVLAATDSLLVGQHVDGVILSLLRDRSRVPLVHGAVQRLTSLGIRVLGAVVNGVKPDGMYGSAYQYLQSGRRSVTAESV